MSVVFSYYANGANSLNLDCHWLISLNQMLIIAMYHKLIVDQLILAYYRLYYLIIE